MGSFRIRIYHRYILFFCGTSRKTCSNNDGKEVIFRFHIVSIFFVRFSAYGDNFLRQLPLSARTLHTAIMIVLVCFGFKIFQVNKVKDGISNSSLSARKTPTYTKPR